MEDSLKISGQMPKKDREGLLNRIVSSSVAEAEKQGKSLALIRPKDTEFYYKPKSDAKISRESQRYEESARQGSFFDKKLAAIEPSPYEFRFKFKDGTGKHDCANGDWEAHAMFFNARRRGGSDEAILDWMSNTFNEKYPKKGMLFCVGNMAKRPQIWQLLGVLRVDDIDQKYLF